MAKPGNSLSNHSQNLRLLILLSCLVTKLLADTHSLSCDIIVKAPTTPLETWCEGRCSMDGEPLLQSNGSKFIPVGDSGIAANGTQVWRDMTQRLEYLRQELRKMLANNKQEITKTSGQPSLRVIMLSKYEHGQIVGASWKFIISGKCSFRLNTIHMIWTLIDQEAGGIMNKLKDDEQLIKDFKIVSTADSRHWLKELLKYQKEKPTSPAAAPDVDQPLSLSIKPKTSVLLIILMCLILILL